MLLHSFYAMLFPINGVNTGQYKKSELWLNGWSDIYLLKWHVSKTTAANEL